MSMSQCLKRKPSGNVVRKLVPSVKVSPSQKSVSFFLEGNWSRWNRGYG